MKHKVVINVTDDNGEKTKVLTGAFKYLPRKIVKWLFGDYTQIYLIAPGKTVDSVDVKEM